MTCKVIKAHFKGHTLMSFPGGIDDNFTKLSRPFWLSDPLLYYVWFCSDKQFWFCFTSYEPFSSCFPIYKNNENVLTNRIEDSFEWLLRKPFVVVGIYPLFRQYISNLKKKYLWLNWHFNPYLTCFFVYVSIWCH